MPYTKLEIAVGSRPTLFGDDVIYLDLRDCGIRPFVQHDMTLPLPFDDEQFDLIQAMHCLEHCSHADTDRILSQWVSKLAHQGLIHIEVPDVAYQAQRILQNPLDDLAVVMMYGTQTDMPNDYNLHRTAFTAQLLARALEKTGLKSVWVRQIGGCLVAEGRRVIAGRKTTVSVLNVTRRLGNLDILVDSLRRQTSLPGLREAGCIDLIIVDEHARDPARREAVKRVYDELGIPVRHAFPEDYAEKTFSKLAQANNLGLHLATGEILFIVNDGMILPADCLQVMLDTLGSFSHETLLTTICHHAARPSLADVVNMQDPYSIFRKPFVAEDYGFPNVATVWNDPRVDQESVSQDPFRWEANVALTRVETLRRAKGWSPLYEGGHGGDNVAMAAAAMLATPGTQVVVVKSLVVFSGNHYEWQPNPPDQKLAEANNGRVLQAYLKGIGDAQRAMAGL